MNRCIVALGGDGVGPEVTEVAVDLLRRMNLDFEIVTPPNGESAMAEYGTLFLMRRRSTAGNATLSCSARQAHSAALSSRF